MNTDRFNPLLVREMRKMVRSRLVVAAVLLYLLALVAYTFYAVFIFVDGKVDPETFGLEMAGPLALGATLFTLVTVVLHTVARLVDDHARKDLAVYTTLTPSQDLRGRLACGFVLSLLFLCMTLPFLSVTYLFRGIDLWVYFAFLPLPLLVVFLFNLLALAVFSAARSPLQAVFYTPLYFGVLALLAERFSCMDQVLQRILDDLRFGRSTFTLPNYKEEILISILCLFGLFFVPITAFLVARCHLSPYVSNRMRPLRRWLTGVIIATFLFALLESMVHDTLFGVHWVRNGSRYFLMEAWIRFVALLLSASLITAVCERETWEGRLRRSIPESRIKRILVFPFYTGGINALFWVFCWVIVLLVGTSLYFFASAGLVALGLCEMPETVFLVMSVFRYSFFLMFIFNYSMSAFSLWNLFLRRRVPRTMVWTVTLTLLVAVVLGTSLATADPAEGFGRLFEYENTLQILNPLTVFFDENYDLIQVVFGVVWFGLIIFFAYPWFKSRFLDFTNKEPGT